jgi:DNA-binding PadR family transcriptional regulator
VWGEDALVLTVIGRGEFAVNGFRNRDLRPHLYDHSDDSPIEQRRRSGQITRKLRMLRAHGLIKKVPKTHRYLLTDKGRSVVVAIGAARNATVSPLSKRRWARRRR